VSGTVSLAPGANVPQCPAGTPRSLGDFVPTLTATTLLDGAGLPLMKTATVSAGAFAFTFLAPDSYTLGHMGVTEVAGTHKLIWTAMVTPGSATIADDGTIVSGVQYIVTAVGCLPL